MVSYSEWVQNQQKLFWDEKAINKQLHQILNKAFYEVYGIAREKNLYLMQLKNHLPKRKIDIIEAGRYDSSAGR